MGCCSSICYKYTKNNKNKTKLAFKSDIGILKHTKAYISPKFKSLLWDHYITNILGDVEGVKCPTCHIYIKHKPNIIYKDQFICGHVIAEANGGQLTIENCRPICFHCNVRMGTKPIQLPVVYTINDI